MLFAAAAFCTTGCLHALGLNRSSLSPRSASLESAEADTVATNLDLSHGTDAIVRSQNDQSHSVGGHSGATISLMSPIQTPKLNLTSGPTPLQSAMITAESANSLQATQTMTRRTNLQVQPSTAAEFQLPNSMEQRPDASRSAITLKRPSASNSNNIGFNAAQLRQFMNQQSLNPMASGHVLADKQAKWDVLSGQASPAQASSGHSATQTASSSRTVSSSPGIQIIPGVIERKSTTEDRPSNNPFQLASNERDVSSVVTPSVETQDVEVPTADEVTFPDGGWQDAASQQPFPSINDQPTVSTIEQAAPAKVSDDSMLDRLKGLYDPSEDGMARRIWKRQMPKLPNPWSVFRDREEPIAAPTVQELTANAADLDATATNPMGSAAPNVTPATGVPSLLTQLVLDYETRLATWPKTPSNRPESADEYQKLQQELRLLYLIEDRPEDAMSAVELLSPAEQQYWQSIVMSLAEYRKAKTSDAPSGHYTGSVHQLRTAIQALSPLADLRIRRLEICSRIHSYGRIETFLSNDFDAGKPLLLYVELENFGSQMTPTGRYLASFDATLQIVEKDKETVKETIRLADITDESTSARSDYYQSYDLTLPSHLMTGEYEIRLKLRDKLSGKTAQRVIGFQVR